MNYKKLCALSLALIVLLSSYGCKKEVIVSPVEPVVVKSISNSYGSSDEDIIHEKDLVEASGWIYYNNPDDYSKLYKRSMDGSENVKITDKFLYGYCIDGEWIYYSDADDNSSLYRVKTDGLVKEKLNNDKSSSVNVSKEWIYYRNSSDNDKLYKIKKDGSGRTKLGEDSVWSIYVGKGDWVYYTNSLDENCIYMIGMDGNERTKITDVSSYHMCVSEEWIYYSISELNENDYPYIYKIKRDGSEKTCLVSGKPHEEIINLEVSGDYIYYYTYNSDEALYRIKKDGTDFKKLSSEGEHISYFNVSKDGLLFTSTFYNDYICKINLRSNKETIINEPPVLNEKHLAEWILYNDKHDKLGVNIVKNVSMDNITGKIKILGNTAYFLVESGDSNNLYKLDINNPEPKMIAKGNIVSYDISGNLIYYYDSSDHTIYKVKTNGTEKKQVSKRETEYIQVNGEWIYFTFMHEAIYRMKVDGTDEQKLASCSWTGSPFKINANWIYFSDKNGLSKIKTDGTEKKFLCEDIYGIGSMLSIKDGRIYYDIIFAEGGGYYNWINGLYSIKLDGTDKQTLLEATFNSLTADNNYIYYNKIIRDSNIIKANPDGTERKAVIPNLGWYK